MKLLPEYMLDPNIEVRFPRCPICKAECDTLYKNKYGKTFGCENCVETVDAYEEDNYVHQTSRTFGLFN